MAFPFLEAIIDHALQFAIFRHASFYPRQSSLWGVTFSTYSSSTYSLPICNKPGNVRVGLVPFALILPVLASQHVVEPIARNKSVGYNKDEYWTKLLQHLRLVALIVVLLFLGYQQSKIHANNWLWAI